MKTNNVTLDWDIDFNTVKQSRNFDKLLDYIDEKRISKDLVFIRHSATGNVHVLIDVEMDEFDAFKLRAHLHDDVYRVLLDLDRSYKSDETNRLWDFKCIAGKTVYAGEWIPLTEFLTGGYTYTVTATRY